MIYRLLPLIAADASANFRLLFQPQHKQRLHALIGP
jgi:hypothetical protein